MNLGAFSVSLNVKDIAASEAFYTALGFVAFHGEPTQGWRIMKNGDTIIGLFSGMIDKNTLTFNPGWDQNAQAVEAFEDVRDIQAKLKTLGADFVSEANPGGTGPASFMVHDPDGNPILIDQHVDRPNQ
jgi:lactoylglutathione lyase